MSKILIVSGSDPWTQCTGYFLYSARLIELLAQRNSICAASLFRCEPDRQTVSVPVKRVWFSKRRRVGRVQRVLALIGRRSFCEMEFAYPGVLPWLSRTIDVEQPKLIIFNHIRAAWLAPLLGRQGMPLLYLAHNAEAAAYASIGKLETNPMGKLFATLEARKLDRLETQIMGTVACAVTLTEEDRERLLKKNRDLPIEVVPPWFEPPTECQTSEARLNTLLIVGSFNWRPKRANIRWFLREVYYPLHRSRPDLRCLIVGANASALRCAMDTGASVELHSDVPQIGPYLRQPTVFVTPERQFGGIKLKTCEAAAYGRAIVSTTPGIEGTGLKSGESCIVADTPADLKSAISRCLDSPVYAAALGSRARTVALARFSRTAVTAKLDLLLKSIFASTAGRVA